MPPAPPERTGLSSDYKGAEALLTARVLKKDEDAFTYLIEFVTAVFIFIIILTAYYKALDSEFSIKDESDDTEVMAVMRILDTLTNTPGLAGNTTEWEKLGLDELDQELKEVGFAYPASASHYDVHGERTEDLNLSSTHGSAILNAAKIHALGNITYPKMKELFSLSHYQLAIRITPLRVTNLSDQQLEYLTLSFGVNVTEGDEKNTVERLFTVSFLNVTDPSVPIRFNHTVVSIKVSLLEGVLDYPRVLISEFNYAPFSGESSEEWVELYNRNDAAVDLRTWLITVEDTEKNFTSHRGSLILQGKSYAVVCADPDILLADYSVDANASVYVISDALFGIDGLPDDEGVLVLEGENTPSDIIRYDSSMGGDDSDRRTLERVSLYGTLFEEGAMDKGTPGF